MQMELDTVAIDVLHCSMYNPHTNCFIWINNSIQIYESKMKKKLKGEPICILMSDKKSGKGFYLHENLIITAHHNFGDSSADIVWAFFPTDDFILIYKIKFNSESYKSYPDADTGVLIFDGDPSPLGDGLYQRVWHYPPRPGIKVSMHLMKKN